MTRYQIIQNDVIEWARGYDGPQFYKFAKGLEE